MHNYTIITYSNNQVFPIAHVFKMKTGFKLVCMRGTTLKWYKTFIEAISFDTTKGFYERRN
jgi:hypothetical protein